MAELSKANQERQITRIRRRDHKLAGVWGGKAPSKRKVAHAVGDVNTAGARTAACGLVGRFVPTSTDWQEYDSLPQEAQCPSCSNILTGARR